MSLAEEIQPIIDACNRTGPSNQPEILVEAAGDDVAMVFCDPPTDFQANGLLADGVAPELEAAGYHVDLEGAIRPIPGYGSGVTTGHRGTSTTGAYRQRAQEPPSLRVRRKD